MGVYFVTFLWKEASFYYLEILSRILQQVSRKIPVNVTQNCHYAVRDPYRVTLEYKPLALTLEPNGLQMLDTYTVYIPTWTCICEWSSIMAQWQRIRFYSELPSLILDQHIAYPGWFFSLTSWVPSDEWTVLPSGPDRFLTKPFRLSYTKPRATRRHTLQNTIASLINL